MENPKDYRRRYWLFVADQYYPETFPQCLHGTYDDEEEALGVFDELTSYDYLTLIDTKKGADIRTK